MNKQVLALLLVGSLAANAWLAVTVSRPADTPDNAAARTAAATPSVQEAGSSAPATAGPADRKSAAPPPAVPVVWHARGNSDEALRALAADLRRAGFPPHVIAAVINTSLREREFAEHQNLPFWQQMRPGKATIELMAAANKRVQAHLKEVLGEEGRPAALLDPSSRQRKYGDLSDDKVDQLMALETDYNDIRRQHLSPTSTMGMEEYRNLQAQNQELQNEKEKDLATILSPAELLDYELRSSETSSRVMRNTANIDLTETEYIALYALYKEAGTTASMLNAGDRQVRNEFYGQVKALLMDDRFYGYLEATDFSYGRIAQYARTQPNIPPATAYEIYQLQAEAETSSRRLSEQMRAGGTSSSETARRLFEERRTQFAAINARLDALIGVEAANAYRQSDAGRLLSMGMPRTNQTVPAQRLPGG